MFSKILTSATLVLALSLQVHAHAGIAPALGVSGTPKRSDVQRPSANSPCGNTKIASTIDTSTPIVAAADGTFKATITNFNGGADGSRKVTATVDASGAGKNFVAATVSTNGDAAPADVGSQPLVAALPQGTKCTGGATGNLCLVSFKTTAGFGNCVVVQQGAAAANNAGSGTAAGGTAGASGNATDAADSTATAGNATASGNATTAAGSSCGHAKHGGVKEGKGVQNANAAKEQIAALKASNGGTRAPRAFLEALGARGEETVAVAKRGIASWIWA